MPNQNFQNPQNPNQNLTQTPKKEEIKTKSKTKTGALTGVIIALVILAAVGFVSWFYFSVFLPPKKPIELLKKTFTQDQLKQFFDYTDKDKNLHDFYVHFGENQKYDIKKDEEVLKKFPRGLYLDPDFYVKYIGLWNLSYLSGNYETFRQNFEKDSNLQILEGDPFCQTIKDDQKQTPKITTAKLMLEKKFLGDNESIEIKIADYSEVLGSENDKSILNLNSQESKNNFPSQYELRLVNEKLTSFPEKSLRWFSLDPKVVLIYPDGKLYPVSKGRTTVLAFACGRIIDKVDVKVQDENTSGKLDTKFLTGFAKSKTSLISPSEVPEEKYIHEVILKPNFASLYGEKGSEGANDIVSQLFAPDTVYIYQQNSPIQGQIRFFMSNDGGKTWQEGDRKIDNTIINLNEVPDIKFTFTNAVQEGKNLKMAVLFQSDFDQSFFKIISGDEKSNEIAGPYINIDFEENDDYTIEQIFNFQPVKVDPSYKSAFLILPPPSPVLTGFSIEANYENLPRESVSVLTPSTPIAGKMPSICQIKPQLCLDIPYEYLPKVEFPDGEEGISFQPIIWHRGHSRVVLKWKFTKGVENNAAASDIDFKYGKNNKELDLGAKVYQDKNDKEYPYYVVITALSGGEYSDKNDSGFEAGRFKYFYQIKTKEKESKVAEFKTLNRLQTIGYYYDLILNRGYVSGEKGNLSAWENLNNEFEEKKIADLESGGPAFFYKPEGQEPLTLLGVKFTMLNDKKYQEFDNILEKAPAEKGEKSAVEDLYRKIHDRIYEDDLGKFFDVKGVEYWVSRLDPKIVGKDVIDIFGVKFAMSVSFEYQTELFGGLGVAVAKPEMAYQIVLKRGADKAGLENLKNKYQLSKDMRKELALSKEYEARLLEIEKSRGRAAAIEELYETLYARAADVQGRDYWDKTGLSILQIRDKFLQSDEFLNVLKD
ncbi:MAG: hypothetical protein AB1465_04775 [Patescibacteria group bacterium]